MMLAWFLFGLSGLGIYAFNFILSSLLGKMFLSRGDAIAMVCGIVMRNLSIALALGINAFGKEGASAALVVAIAYIIQVQSPGMLNSRERFSAPRIQKTKPSNHRSPREKERPRLKDQGTG